MHLMDFIIGILSFIASIVALCVAWRAYKLQKKSDKDLQQIENNMNQLEQSVQNISEIQDKLAFETEKNRLKNIVNTNIPENEKKELNSGIDHIFDETKFKVVFINENKQQTNGNCKIRFIKENEKPHALPKVHYPFNRIHDFPYFCVEVSEVEKK